MSAWGHEVLQGTTMTLVQSRKAPMTPSGHRKGEATFYVRHTLPYEQFSF